MADHIKAHIKAPSVAARKIVMQSFKVYDLLTKSSDPPSGWLSKLRSLFGSLI